jgi:hypothetical protein
VFGNYRTEEKSVNFTPYYVLLRNVLWKQDNYSVRSILNNYEAGFLVDCMLSIAEKGLTVISRKFYPPNTTFVVLGG